MLVDVVFMDDKLDKTADSVHVDRFEFTCLKLGLRIVGKGHVSACVCVCVCVCVWVGGRRKRGETHYIKSL